MPVELLDEPGFESGGADWSFFPAATVVAGGRSGAYALQLGPSQPALALHTLPSDTQAGDIRFSCWAKRTVGTDAALNLFLLDDGGTLLPTVAVYADGTVVESAGGSPLVTVGHVADLDNWFQLSFKGTLPAYSGALSFGVLRTADGQPTANTWLVDDCSCVGSRGTEVAVKLAERGIDAVTTLLQNNLAAELAAIVTERGDSDTLTAPATASYYNHPKAEIAGGTTATHIEVFEGGYEFPNPYTDQDAQRAVYELPLTIRLTLFDRDGVDAQTIHTRLRRYTAGVFNVLNKNPTVADSDDATQVITPESVVTPWEITSEADGHIKAQVTMLAMVRCEEVQT